MELSSISRPPVGHFEILRSSRATGHGSFHRRHLNLLHYHFLLLFFLPLLLLLTILHTRPIPTLSIEVIPPSIMVELISPPDPRTLLPPLLACLPTAFVSPRPPPALLPLLSPILRQRTQFLNSVSASSSDSWLRLLCWDSAKAERVQSIVDEATFEPHPVSGEIDLPEDIHIAYKRIDDETLQARLLLPEFRLTVIYLWCPDDEPGGGRGWRVAELLPREGPAEDDSSWTQSIGEANERASQKLFADVLDERREAQAAYNASGQAQSGAAENEEDDDDDYWAQYDATPGSKTPAARAAPTSHQPSGLSEASYYSQYGNVQPAMDSHDPEEEQSEVGPSSLNGDMLASLLRRQVDDLNPSTLPRTNGYAAGETPNDAAARSLSHPRPASVSSGSSDAVAKLEQEAESQSSYEVGVKQHIGTSIKSLFRLAKATGMSRADFQSMVHTELELLEVTDADD
ncbi:hypothetical protein PDE_00912 [Penicillium oxalicum 114-2]|uniref:Uncharacterized protein n=2 Tax=Penicillium oxalicum TaxID=69781 RepID=S7ZBB6_PENO1|nr:hypothetical protein PDE_00912 [Penicillium oxalicum 114-2]